MNLYQFVKKYHITKTTFIAYSTCIFVIIYFLFCTLFAQKGLISYFNLKKKMDVQDIKKQELISKMQTKKNMVEGMNVDSLDLDLLDEEARRALGYSNKNEVVIYKKND